MSVCIQGKTVCFAWNNRACKEEMIRIQESLCYFLPSPSPNLCLPIPQCFESNGLSRPSLNSLCLLWVTSPLYHITSCGPGSVFCLSTGNMPVKQPSTIKLPLHHILATFYSMSQGMHELIKCILWMQSGFLWALKSLNSPFNKLRP